MCVSVYRGRERDLKRIRMHLPQTVIFLLSTKEIKENLDPFLWVTKLRITFLVTYTHEVMTDKLNGWGHTRPVQTFPLPPTVRLDTLGDFWETSEIEVEAVKTASAQQLREAPQDFTRAGYVGLRPGWRSMEKEGQHWCCQVLSTLPVQVGPAAKWVWVWPGETEDGEIRPRYLLGSNSTFIHSDVTQR